MARFLRTLVGLLVVAACNRGAIAADRATAERDLTFTVFATAPVLDLAYRPKYDADLCPLVGYPTARSSPYSYIGPASLSLANPVTGARVLGVNIPADVGRALLILHREDYPKNQHAEWRAWVLDDSEARHTPGQVRIVNHSGLRLSGNVGGTQRTVESDGVEFTVTGRKVSIDLRTRYQERSYSSYRDTIILGLGERALVILLPPYHRGSLEVQSRVLIDGPERARR